MLLESIEAHNFRNLGGEIFWGEGLNVISGENGQGKTNWLEAIYLLATTKSFRHSGRRAIARRIFGIRGRVARAEDCTWTCRSASGSSQTSRLSKRSR